MGKEFTGRHMAAILVLFFGVIVAVNVTMARFAISTFGGVVVENSYVASQEFNGWLGEAEQQAELGWTIVPQWREDGRLALALEGVPGGATIAATARHPVGRLPDMALSFAPAGAAGYLSEEILPSGRWIVRIEIEAAGQRWRKEEDMRR